MERAAEVAAHVHLEQFKRSVEGKPRLGVEIFGKALLVVPKTLLENSGMDVQDLNMRGKQQKTVWGPCLYRIYKRNAWAEKEACKTYYYRLWRLWQNLLINSACSGMVKQHHGPLQFLQEKLLRVLADRENKQKVVRNPTRKCTCPRLLLSFVPSFYHYWVLWWQIFILDWV